jgi:O-antigen/teichoic acid export membrane protein
MTDAQPAPEQEGLRGRVLTGFTWVAASQIVLQVVRPIIAVVLARLLTPSEYGLAAMVLVFASLVMVFGDLALGAALVQRKVLTEDDRSTAFWTSVATGVLFTIIGVALSGPIAHFFGDSSLQAMCAVLSLTFVITSVATTQESLLVREMSFRALQVRTVLAVVISGIGAIALAAAGLGAWAIIFQQLIFAIVSTALLWWAGSWRPQLRFSRASLRDMWGFSGNLLGHRLLFYVHRNADSILIGRVLGSAALGAYSVAYNVMLVPFTRIGGPLQQVLAPAFARLQDDRDKLAESWARAVRLIGLLAIPSLVGLVVVAPDFVTVILGDKWDAAAPLVRVLAVVGVLQALQSVNIDILMARNRTATVFRYSILFTCCHITAFVIGLQWGVLGVATAYAISSLLVEPVLTILTARAIDVSPMVFVRAVADLFAASAVMAAVVAASQAALTSAGVPPLPRLIIDAAIGAAVFTGLVLWRMPSITAEVKGLLAQVRGRRRAAGAAGATA